MGEPYIFTGPQGTARKNGRNKGVMRLRKQAKRQEAQARQAEEKKTATLTVQDVRTLLRPEYETII